MTATAFTPPETRMFIWQAHQGKVRSLAFSPDGRLLATATGTGRLISLWDPLTGERVRKLTPAPSAGRAAFYVAFAPDAPLFAAGLHGRVCVWNTETWGGVATLGEAEGVRPGGWVGNFYEMAFSRGPTPRLAASDSSKVRIWDNFEPGASASRKAGCTFSVDNVPSLDFSPSGELLAVNVLSQAAIHSALTGERVQRLDHTHSQHHGPIRFSPDGQRVAVGYRNLVSIYPVHPNNGAGVTCAGHKKAVWSAGWAADGQSLYTASADGTARQWNPTTGAELRTFEWGIGEILSTAFSADGLLGAAASKGGKVVVWDLDS